MNRTRYFGKLSKTFSTKLHADTTDTVQQKIYLPNAPTVGLSVPFLQSSTSHVTALGRAPFQGLGSGNFGLHGSPGCELSGRVIILESVDMWSDRIPHRSGLCRCSGPGAPSLSSHLESELDHLFFFRLSCTTAMPITVTYPAICLSAHGAIRPGMSPHAIVSPHTGITISPRTGERPRRPRRLHVQQQHLE